MYNNMIIVTNIQCCSLEIINDSLVSAPGLNVKHLHWLQSNIKPDQCHNKLITCQQKFCSNRIKISKTSCKLNKCWVRVNIYCKTFDLLASRYQNFTWRLPTVTNMLLSSANATSVTYNQHSNRQLLQLNRTMIQKREPILRFNISR